MIRLAIKRSDLIKLQRLESTFFRLAGVDQRTPLEEAGAYMHEQIADRFKREAGSRGKWPRLKDHTVTDRWRLGYEPAHPILQRPQGLIKAATGYGHTRLNPGDVHWQGTTYKGSRVKAIWELNTIGGPVGGNRQTNRMVQHELTIGVEADNSFVKRLNRYRPFMYSTKMDESRIQRIYKDWVQDRIDYASERMFEQIVGGGLAQRFR